MDDRLYNKLFDLICYALSKSCDEDCKGCPHGYSGQCKSYIVAKYLIEHGVTISEGDTNA